ncbi:hypothetical protein J2X76_000881 [Neorhizobium sp. 2083]|uniref:hypothetical protein n=1 Tax=Neorhizobium sp. 2083 TaxID=2817762 RepID=UPI0013AE9A44|nr:hypothetical protein [Neorhizobium sp. 2083]MDR6815727.1 hypothetical protein [Neorhizobium sp. 2083]
MSRAIHYMRGQVYPRSRRFGNPDRLHASNIILGMLAVMLVVLVAAYAVTFAAAS